MRKRGFGSHKLEQDRELVSSEFSKDDEARLFKAVLRRIKRRYKLSSTDVLDLTKEEVMIPCTVFNKELSPLETGVKYLKENLDLEYSEIADMLARDRKTVWQAYKNALKKFPAVFEPAVTDYKIPVAVLRSDLSVLEAVVVFLKEQFNLSYHNIGELLHRNERTVWTVYYRAQKKNVAK